MLATGPYFHVLMNASHLLSLTLAMLLATGASYGQQTETTPQSAAKVGTLLRYIDQLYVDSVNLEDLMETAVVRMLEDLDPTRCTSRQKN